MKISRSFAALSVLTCFAASSQAVPIASALAHSELALTLTFASDPTAVSYNYDPGFDFVDLADATGTGGYTSFHAHHWPGGLPETPNLNDTFKDYADDPSGMYLGSQRVKYRLTFNNSDSVAHDFSFNIAWTLHDFTQLIPVPGEDDKTAARSRVAVIDQADNSLVLDARQRAHTNDDKSSTGNLDVAVHLDAGTHKTFLFWENDVAGSLVGGTSPAQDAALADDSFAAVPEPFSMLTLGLGIVTLVSKRRRA